MNRKWFYSALTELGKQLQERYEFCTCDFQQITEERVIEMWKVQHSENDKPETIFAVITKSGSNHSQLMLWKAEFMKGHPVTITN